ncbi:MAG TPA: phosphate ABC transporter permease PstA [Candidatus Limnocylindria bacterium]|nr:phosphate ABC transporter permease PstA [Candidatus Limnocylindria bacterium]
MAQHPARQTATGESRRRTSSVRRDDVLALGGSGLAAVSLSGLLYGWVVPFSGPIGFVLVTYAIFLAVYALVVSLDEPGPIVRDRVVAIMVHTAAALLVGGLVLVIAYTFIRGWPALTHWNFFTQDLSASGPLDPLTVGGILHAMVGTLMMIAIALSITIPLGLTCAVYLNQVPGRFTRFVRTVVEAMTALPSIVAGLFIYAAFILILGLEKSGFAAACAITVMMLPIIIRAADVVLRLVPGSLTEASLAVGAGQWRTVWNVILPTARSGLTTAVILGTARGIGETSPVLLTAGYTASLNTNPIKGPQVSLPLAVFQLVKSPEPGVIARGFGAAAVLMMLVLLLFVLARIIGGRGPGSLTRRQEHRAVVASRRDAERFERRAPAAPETSSPVHPALPPTTPSDS